MDQTTGSTEINHADNSKPWDHLIAYPFYKLKEVVIDIREIAFITSEPLPLPGSSLKLSFLVTKGGATVGLASREEADEIMEYWLRELREE